MKKTMTVFGAVLIASLVMTSCGGNKFELTSFTPNKTYEFHEYSIMNEFYDYLEFPAFTSIKDSCAYLKKLIRRSEKPNTQYWYIHSKKFEKVVGTIGLLNLDNQRLSVEMGYGISPHHWGQGFLTSAGKIIIKYVFNNLQLHRLVARTSIENVPSMRGLTKLGFKKEGILRDYYRRQTGEWFDAVLMAQLDTD